MRIIVVILLVLTIQAKAFVVNTNIPNSGVSKTYSVLNGTGYTLNFDSDLLTTNNLEVSVHDLGVIVSKKEFVSEGMNRIDFIAQSNQVTVHFTRKDNDQVIRTFEVRDIRVQETHSKKGKIKGNNLYEVNDHLNNVSSTVSDLGKVNSTVDYYPFGMQSRKKINEKYRYSFTGMEDDDEWTGANSHYDFEARMYEGRLGKWLAIDPLAKKYPGQTCE